MTTLKEIAKAAGVSTTTVSNVINGNHRRVSAKTVETINRLIRESGYIPNQFARSLAQRESRIVAIIVQAVENENILLNPYTAGYVGALTLHLFKRHYSPLLRFTDDFSTVENAIRGWNVAGALFNGSYKRLLQSIESLSPIPCVFTDCYFDLPGVNHVRIDDEGGGRIAGDYLADKGHRRIGFVANALQDSDVDQRRLSGLRQSLAARGLEVPDQWILPTADDLFQGDRLEALLRAPERPTAFFCSADVLAAHLMHRCLSLGLRVPEDMSVIGFDDLPFTSFYTYGLTTIAQDLDQKAAMAVDILVRHIEDKTLPPERATLGVKLIERDSVLQRS